MIDPYLVGRVAGPLVDRLLGLGESRTAEVKINSGLAITLPDGATLAADHYRPIELDRGPVVLIRTPYNRASPWTVLPAVAMARRGLQVLVQDVRGTFDSPGDFEPFRHETDDGLATLGWLREQDWCDGRVGTVGASYLGYTQWAVAPYAEPELAAMAIAVSASDFRPTFYPGGSVGWETLLSWSSGIGTQEDEMPFWRRMALARGVRARMATLPARSGTAVTIGKEVRFLTDVLEHGEPDDDHWDFLDHSEDLDQLRTPTSMVAGWYDIFLGRQLRDFAALQAAGVPVRITVGPWWHGDAGAQRTVHTDQIDWMVGHLLDDPVILNRAPVRIFLQQANRWLDFDQWPVEADDQEYLLDVDASLHTDQDQLGRSGIRTFVYDPADPTPIVGGATLGSPGGQRDNRAVEARSDVLTYQTEPLPGDLDVIGEPRAEIAVRTEHPDTDLFVRVCDVSPNGRSLNVVEGIRRLRATDEAVDELGTRRASITLTPTGYRFLAGHRIRVQITGGGFPNYLRNHQTGEPIADAVRTESGRTQILHGGDQPSTITLPIHRR